jgi:Major Facilitator Superfamily
MSTISGKPGLRSITARQWLILLAVQLSSLLFGMTITLANVVLPQIRGALSTTHDEIAWVVTLNLAATAVATPTTGWLASRLGWRGVMFGGVGGFTLFSLLCGLANSLETLVLYRVGQGLCGAVIMPMGQAIVLATFARELHAAVMVIWGFGSVVGPVVGPVIGSMIAELYSWRAVFFYDRPARADRNVLRVGLARRQHRTHARSARLEGVRGSIGRDDRPAVADRSRAAARLVRIVRNHRLCGGLRWRLFGCSWCTA